MEGRQRGCSGRAAARARSSGYPSTWTADGSTLIFEHDSAVNKFDLWQMVPGGDPRSLLANPADEKNARLSPDNRWLAHMSDESGRAEVYVRPFPNVNDDKWMISTAGGHSPVWSHDGRSLFYMSGTAVFEVRVESRGSTPVASAPELLFSGPFDTTQDENYDVFPDGHFVMVEADPHSRPTHLQLVSTGSTI